MSIPGIADRMIDAAFIDACRVDNHALDAVGLAKRRLAAAEPGTPEHHRLAQRAAAIVAHRNNTHANVTDHANRCGAIETDPDRCRTALADAARRHINRTAAA